jgi:succinate dehydrogenase / fumarate reductase iron-sulfur subunit
MKKISLILKVWRQKNSNNKGQIKTYYLKDLNIHMSFLEMMDVLNDQLEKKNEEPVAFSHDCREGICGACGFMINGKPHGGYKRTTTCQLHLRHFQDGETVIIEPWRANSFPVIKDLVVVRSSFDKIIEAGGYISVKTGNAPEANSIPIKKNILDTAFDAAACIGCGACVASCKNSSAMLFTAAKVSHLNLLPQGAPESMNRVRLMIDVMDKNGFGNCTNEGECEATCPKGISVENITRLNREFIKSFFRE